MFLELLNNEVFTAKNLVTPWNQTKKAQLGSKIPRNLLTEALTMNVDNIPICSGSDIIGYAKREQLHPGEVVTRKLLYRGISRCVVNPSSRLPDLADRIRSDGLRDYELYVVRAMGKPPLGVMTYADLNRRTVYIYCYILLNFLEQWVKGRIVMKYREPNRSLSPLWMTSLGAQREKELFEDAEGRGQTPLGVADLSDLVQVLREDLKPRMGNDWRRMVNAAMMLRTRVAHPVKLLLPKADLNSLRNLIYFWRGMMPLVQKNDFNERNRGWPVHPE